MSRLDLESFARALLGRRSVAQPGHAPAAGAQPATRARGRDDLIWNESSFDLRSGLDIWEHPLDTLPGDLRVLFERA